MSKTSVEALMRMAKVEPAKPAPEVKRTIKSFLLPEVNIKTLSKPELARLLNEALLAEGITSCEFVGDQGGREIGLRSTSTGHYFGRINSSRERFILNDQISGSGGSYRNQGKVDPGDAESFIKKLNNRLREE